MPFFLTPRPLLNDNVTRWIFIAIVGLVSAVGLWELNVTIVWESLWAAIEFDILLLLCAATYSIVGTQTPRIGWSTAVVSDLLLSIFAAYSGVESLYTAHLPCSNT